MITKRCIICLWVLFFSCHSFFSQAQDKRVQYPGFLSKAYFEVNIGSIHYPFTARQLEPGYTVESIEIPHTAVRLVLLGYQFNKYLSAQISYMRPVLWVGYKNVNGDYGNHAVFMNIGGLTLKPQLPISDKFIVYGEGGLGVITRSGFEIDQKLVLKDANYATFLLGGGVKYRINKKWDLVASTTYSPAHKPVKQPHTVFYSGGFTYHLQPLPPEKVERNASSGYIFPRQMVQIGYTTNVLGYGVNNFVSEGAIPIFWGGKAEIEKGVTLQYQRTIFRTRKVFSIDWGATAGYYKSRVHKDEFFTLSLFPMVRFTPLRLKPLDLYFNYSAAGPTYISKTFLEGFDTGKRFTFQDFMGMGIYAGKLRNLNFELRIAHYSNGNIFPQNAGVKIPLTFNLGYTF